MVSMSGDASALHLILTADPALERAPRRRALRGVMPNMRAPR
jgi:hypothetical protein